MYGGVVGICNGTTSNCTNDGCIISNRQGGGIVGTAHGDVIGCINYGDSISEGTHDLYKDKNGNTVSNYRAHVGGVVGINFSGNIKNCENRGNITAGGYYSGGIVGMTYKNIDNCTNTGKVLSTGYTETYTYTDGTVEDDTTSYAGGIAGGVQGKITNCSNTGEIIGSGSYVGGIAAFCYEGLESCENKGNIKGLDVIGGIAGQTTNVSFCLNYGTVEGDYGVGGIVGISYTGGVITNSYNSGNVIGDDDWVGGIVGGCFGAVEKCYNEGAVELKSRGNYTSYDPQSGNIGGICGATGASKVILVRNNYNKGTIIVNRGTVTGVGGVIGWISTGNASGTVHHNYSIGKIEINADNVKKVGGAVGKLDAKADFTLNNNYYIVGTTKTADNNIGEEKTMEEMKIQAFVDLLNEGQEEAVWEINGQNEGYPVIKNFMK